MSDKNLKALAGKLGDIYGLNLKKGQKDPYRQSLERYIPQVFAQDLKEIRAELKDLSKPHTSKLANGENFPVLPIITVSIDKCITLYKDIFAAEKKWNYKQTFNGKKVGTDGIILTKKVWLDLHKHARTKVGSGEWLFCPCRNLTRVDENIKKLYAEKLAALEVQHRNKSKDDRRTDDVEESYITRRLTGHQGSKVPVQGKGWVEYRPGKGMTDYEKTQTGVQLGHGEKGAATFAYRLDEAKKLIQEAKVKDKKAKKRLIKGIYKLEEELKVDVEHREVIDLKSGMKKAYRFMFITGQRTSGNVKDQAGEVLKGTKAQDHMKKFILKEHKSRLDKTIGALLLHKFTKNNRGVRNTSKRYIPKARIKSNEKAKGKKQKFKRNAGIVIGTGSRNLGVAAASIVAKSKRVKKKKPISSRVSTIGSPMQLLSIFNASLEQSIRENMGGKALHNRTGRFAGSVSVLNVLATKGTDGTIQYTYQRDPYEVFEGQGARDPRLLIDKTIREQAAEMALGKFTTMRV